MTQTHNRYYYTHPYRNPSVPVGYYSREEWLESMLRGEPMFQKLKPPRWWIEAQAKEGRTGGSAYAIWHKNYPPARRYAIWDQAPDEDWREHGYLV